LPGEFQPSARLSYAAPSDPFLARAAIRFIELISGQRRLVQMYQDMVTAEAPTPSPAREQRPEDTYWFWNSAIKRLMLDVKCDPLPLPESGPAIVIANHPYGVLDGLVICWLVSAVRRDFRIVANTVLHRAPEVAHAVLPVDFADNKDALKTNLQTRRASREWLADGHVLIIFPAGGVSTSKRGIGPAIDLEWKSFTAGLIHQYRTPVIPVWFHGQNSRLFQLVSQFSATLRLSLFFHEVARRMNTTIEATVGDLIPYATLEEIPDRNELTQWLRDTTHKLARSNNPQGK